MIVNTKGLGSVATYGHEYKYHDNNEVFNKFNNTPCVILSRFL